VQKAVRLLALSLALPAACVPDERPDTGPAPARSSKAAERISSRPSNPFGAAARTAASGKPVEAVRVPTTSPTAADPPLTGAFKDDFDRPALGADWTTTSAAWTIRGGRLCVAHAKNHPAWLKRQLPTNARVEFEATTTSTEGDIKAEYWGDGRSAAETVSYNAATSYLTIFGGWKNTFHVLARIDEHAPNRPELRLDDEDDDLRARKVQPNRTYHFKVSRDDGKTVRWYVDDLEILSFTDPAPLKGPGHDHFGFNNWDVSLCFDNLVVTPLP
jgi:hypothetical protein